MSQRKRGRARTTGEALSRPGASSDRFKLQALFGLLLLAAGLAGYLALFFLAPMPTLGRDQADHPLRRLDLLPRLVLLDEIVGGWFGDPPQFAVLDRLPVLGLAGGILTTAAVLGWLLMRLTRAERQLAPLEQTVFACGV